MYQFFIDNYSEWFHQCVLLLVQDLLQVRAQQSYGYCQQYTRLQLRMDVAFGNIVSENRHISNSAERIHNWIEWYGSNTMPMQSL